jgi:hypothetical protein
MMQAVRDFGRRVLGGRRQPGPDQKALWESERAMGLAMRALVQQEGWNAVEAAITARIAVLSSLETIKDEGDLQLRKARVQELQGVLDLPRKQMELGERAAKELAALAEDTTHGG